jgi:hypothetical protein
MRILLLTFIPLTIAFAPNLNHQCATRTKLNVSRRDAMLTGAAMAGILIFPVESKAFSQQLDDNLTEVTQLPTGGKLDLNSAYVVRICYDCTVHCSHDQIKSSTFTHVSILHTKLLLLTGYYSTG